MQPANDEPTARSARQAPAPALHAASFVASLAVHVLGWVGAATLLAGGPAAAPPRQSATLRLARADSRPPYRPSAEQRSEVKAPELPPDDVEPRPLEEPVEAPTEEARQPRAARPSPRPLDAAPLLAAPPLDFLRFAERAVEEAASAPEETAAAPPPQDPAPPPAEAASDGEGGSTAPALLEAPSPVYPRNARRFGWEGTVVCRMEVAADGRVSAVVIERTSGHDALDDAARDALLRWRFRPALEDGLPVATSVRHRVVFRLEDA